MVGGDEATTIALQLQRHRISKRVAYAKHADKVSRLSGTAAREAGAPRRLTAEAQLEFDLSAEALLAALGFDFCSPRCAAACPRAIKLAGQNVLSALRREECRTAEHLRRLIPAVQDGHVTGNVLLPSAHGSQHFPNGVCPNAYRAILAIKRSRWKRLRKKAVEAAAAGATEMIGRSLWTDLFAQPRVPVKHAIIWAWVEDWLRWHGDHNPMNGRIMVVAQPIDALWAECGTYVLREYGVFVSYLYFCKVFSQRRNDPALPVEWRKRLAVSSVCRACTKYHEDLEAARASKDSDKLRALKEKHQWHLNFLEAARPADYERRMKSGRGDEGAVLTAAACDIMDQAKTAVPYFALATVRNAVKQYEPMAIKVRADLIGTTCINGAFLVC